MTARQDKMADGVMTQDFSPDKLGIPSGVWMCIGHAIGSKKILE